MHVVGRDEGRVYAPGDLGQLFVSRFVFGLAVILQLDIKIIRADHRLKVLGYFKGALELILPEQPTDLAAATPRQNNQPVTVSAQQFFVYPGFVIKPLNVAQARQFH
ncbi:hypothetical protein HRbin07_00505 [bacterium HR07]|nr:hypothetical protein HRbin07_00505 [bacterium HR07]